MRSGCASTRRGAGASELTSAPGDRLRPRLHFSDYRTVTPPQSSASPSPSTGSSPQRGTRDHKRHLSHHGHARSEGRPCVAVVAFGLLRREDVVCQDTGAHLKCRRCQGFEPTTETMPSPFRATVTLVEARRPSVSPSRSAERPTEGGPAAGVRGARLPQGRRGPQAGTTDPRELGGARPGQAVAGEAGARAGECYPAAADNVVAHWNDSVIGPRPIRR